MKTTKKTKKKRLSRPGFNELASALNMKVRLLEKELAEERAQRVVQSEIDLFMRSAKLLEAAKGLAGLPDEFRQLLEIQAASDLCYALQRLPSRVFQFRKTGTGWNEYVQRVNDAAHEALRNHNPGKAEPCPT